MNEDNKQLGCTHRVLAGVYFMQVCHIVGHNSREYLSTFEQLLPNVPHSDQLS